MTDAHQMMFIAFCQFLGVFLLPNVLQGVPNKLLLLLLLLLLSLLLLSLLLKQNVNNIFLQMVQKVLLSYAELVSKEFESVCSDEKTVSVKTHIVLCLGLLSSAFCMDSFICYNFAFVFSTVRGEEIPLVTFRSVRRKFWN